MRRRLLALVLVAVAVVAATAAVAAEEDDTAVAGEALPSASTPVLSARRVPGLLAAPVADRRLAEALEATLARQEGERCLTVASSGRPVFQHNADRQLVPASVEKLVTAMAALEVLGPDFRFTTRVLSSGPDLWLVGGGDPLLATAAYAARFRNQPQVRTALEDLADAVVAAGITRVEGRLLGDEARYDTDRYPDEWPGRFVEQDQSGPLSALTVNDAWVAFPPNPDTRVPDETPAPDPARHAAEVLGALLAERGVTVAVGFGSGGVPAGAGEIAAVDSPRLGEIVGQMLRESDNQTAELVLKELAVASGRPGTTADGAAVVADAVDGSVVVDGSGLASSNLVTCALVQEILDEAGTSSVIADGLPVAGETGTLAERFLDSVVTGRLRAKTGTLNQVTSLAGYLTTTVGAELSFSFVANLPPSSIVDEEDLRLQDELAAVLARYPEGPPLDQLGPERR